MCLKNFKDMLPQPYWTSGVDECLLAEVLNAIDSDSVLRAQFASDLRFDLLKPDSSQGS